MWLYPVILVATQNSNPFIRKSSIQIISNSHCKIRRLEVVGTIGQYAEYLDLVGYETKEPKRGLVQTEESLSSVSYLKFLQENTV